MNDPFNEMSYRFYETYLRAPNGMTSIIYRPDWWLSNSEIQLDFNNEIEAQYTIACWTLFIEGEL